MGPGTVSGFGRTELLEFCETPVFLLRSPFFEEDFLLYLLMSDGAAVLTRQLMAGVEHYLCGSTCGDGL
jgi:hypothetical protein